MSATALALALGAAVLHAGWNLLLAGSRDTEAAAGGLLGYGFVLLGVLALVTGSEVSSEALPYVAASAALELAYFLLLARAYRDGSVSVVYPVARGVAPAFVLCAALVGLGKGVDWLAGVGVVAICSGVVLLGFGEKVPHSDTNSPNTRVDVAFGLAIALAIASYTLVDAEGVERADPVAYLALVVAPAALLYPLVTRTRPDLGLRSLTTAAASFGAFLMVLLALQKAPAAPVAATRETSILLVTLFAAVFLHERLTPAKLAASAAILAGVAAIAYS